jgi:3-dehydroquinate synthase
LHLDQIATGGDPFESGSARPLDFGHWAAHKLEQLSHFRMAHGEAVAVGLALDVIYSRNTGLLAAAPAARILNLLERLGLDLFAGELLNTDRLGTPVILSGLEEFREHLGGDLSVTMLTDIGHHVEVHELDPRVIAAAIGELRARKRG